MNPLPPTTHMFCPEHSNCEAPISVITNILSRNDPMRYEKISNQFKLLGFTKIKNLAQTSYSIASSIDLCGDSLKLLYEALEIYNKQIDDLLKSAKLENQNGNFTKTQQICEELLKQKPNDFNVIMLMAESFFKCGNYEKSINVLESAKALNPNSFEVLSNIASNYWKQSQYDLAKYYLAEAIQKKPNYNNGWINYAEALIKTNDIKFAEHIYIKFLNLKPDSYTVRNKYGRLLLSLNKIKNAKQQFKIAQKSAPKCQETLINLGDIYFMIDKFEKAILNYHKALEVNPKLKITLINLGMAYLKLTDYQNAVHAFEKANKLDPENISNLRYLVVGYFYQGNILLCVETYKKYLKVQPDNIDINFELALIYFNNLTDYEEAENYFKICIELNSQRKDLYQYLFVVYKKLNKFINASDICISLGDLYLDSFDLENARNVYTTAVNLNPENPHGHWKVGLILHKLGHFDLALSRYKKAIDLKPNFTNAYCDSAIIYEKYNLYEKALDYYKMTLQLQPDHLNALINISLLKQKMGQFDGIVEIFKKILEIDESDAFDIHMNLANILHKKNGNLNEALFHYEKALEYDYRSIEIYVHIGNIYTELNMSKKALSYFYLAIKLDSRCLEAYINVGSIQRDSDNFIDAIHAYEAVLKLNPDCSEVYCNLVLCLQKVCDWSNYDSNMIKLKEIINKQLEDDQVLSILPHDSLLFPLSSEVQKKIAIKYAQQCVEGLEKSIEEPQQFLHPTSLNGKLKIGFISTNFSKHPITNIMEYAFRMFSARVQFFFYSLSSNDNSPSWMKNTSENLNLKNLSHLRVIDAAKIINSDEIHVLVDMCGYTKSSLIEIFALRPAPIQVSWLNNPNTSNLTFIDYFFRFDAYSSMNPPNEYNGKLLSLHSTIFPGNHMLIFSKLIQRKVQENIFNILDKKNVCLYYVPDFDNQNMRFYDTYIQEQPLKEYVRALYNLPDNVIVFCNFSKLYKIDPFTFRMWLNILNNVPNSVLWLLHLNDAAENNLRKFASDLNFDTTRIIFADFITEKYRHLNRIQLADIYLDSYLYNGHMACLDALWAGVPVITLPGKTFVSCVTASHLSALGFFDTIAKNEENYIEIAIELGMNKQLLENIKNKIWDLKKLSNLFKIDLYTNEIMECLINTWKIK